MNEREHAVSLANKVLERVSADPDDDLAVLARRLLHYRDILMAANHTLFAHGKIDSETPLHQRIAESI